MKAKPGKWTISKRIENDGHPASIIGWPWLLTYPSGGTCLCFSHSSAIEIIKDSQFKLRCEQTHFNWLKDRYLAGAIREELVKK